MPLTEYLVTADVIMADVETAASQAALNHLQAQALRPWLITADRTGLEPVLVREWMTYITTEDGAPGLDYGITQLWLAPDAATLRAILDRLPLVTDMGRMTVQHVTALTPTDLDPGGEHLRDRNRHHTFTGEKDTP